MGASSPGNQPQWGTGAGSNCKDNHLLPPGQLRGMEASGKAPSGSLHCQQTGKEESSPLLLMVV